MNIINLTEMTQRQRLYYFHISGHGYRSFPTFCRWCALEKKLGLRDQRGRL